MLNHKLLNSGRAARSPISGIGLEVIGTVEIGLRVIGPGFSGQPDVSRISWKFETRLFPKFWFWKLVTKINKITQSQSSGEIEYFEKCKNSAKIRSKQKEELRQTIFQVVIYLLHIISLFYISSKILPEEKFFSDFNFRRNIEIERGRKFHIEDIWSLVESDLMTFIHLNRS